MSQPNRSIFQPMERALFSLPQALHLPDRVLRVEHREQVVVQGAERPRSGKPSPGAKRTGHSKQGAQLGSPVSHFAVSNYRGEEDRCPIQPPLLDDVLQHIQSAAGRKIWHGPKADGQGIADPSRV